MENLKQQIKEIENQQHELAKKKGDLQQQLAELACPFKIGDVGIIGGYSYKGSRGKVVVVEYAPLWDWQIKVALFRKDGVLGANQSIIYRKEDFTLVGVA